jgi:hypothetical protein
VPSSRPGGRTSIEHRHRHKPAILPAPLPCRSHTCWSATYARFRPHRSDILCLRGLANLGRFVRASVSVMRCSRFTVAMTRRMTGRAKGQPRSVWPAGDTCGGVMDRALGDGDGKCSSIHGATSPLLTALRPGVRALDRVADLVEASRLAGDSAAANLGGRRHPERGRRKPAACPTGRRGIARFRRGTRTCPAARSVTLR